MRILCFINAMKKLTTKSFSQLYTYGDRTSTGSVSVENSERGFMVILTCTVVDKVIILFTNFHVEKDFTVEFSEKYTV